ncbi:hypothetical protein B0T26DRAFT_638777 [Lasiosphaeria miniovina]|uniref:YCII-related domain-containing protein n=1 Tax=Lasiosphaeria miniovina TaxID=1954250 RepID=A0AA40E973_9PEZI|nr:uncharacterized protein B0T26DRAFT_638777 [Lasiosphaeria miniovina]KAK0727008.1 hypothetical protein B0T26DRAFT_638777 [Lasiosphaeria miniovina]
MSSSADPVAAAAAAAAAPARKFEWLVVVPDTPGALEKRKEIRSQHLGGLKPAVESGLLKMGGAILEEVPSEDDPTNLKMCGSTLIIVAASKDDILEALNKDIYAQTGVWDVAKVCALLQ